MERAWGHGMGMTMTEAATASATSACADGYNLLGQRLGRKGRDTRQRILDGLARRLAQDDGAPVSLSAVAREASVAMTTLYIYFADLGELILAALEPVVEDAQSLQVMLRPRWSDAQLPECCKAYVQAHQEFWRCNARVLHLRNSFADAGDRRFLRARIDLAAPLIRGLIRQMDGEPEAVGSICFHVAVLMMTGIERVSTTVTGPYYEMTLEEAAIDLSGTPPVQIEAAARMLELAIRDQRSAARQR